MHSSNVLTSWKEIAAHLGKGVRTVQRWERELGLPVRRPVGNSKHVVLAVPSELDVWVSRGFAARDSAGGRHPTSDTFRHRVLLADDDKKFLQITKALLESKEFEVLTAQDGFAGLATLKRALPDIIISELRMPNMNGFEFLSVVRHRFPHLPVIAISGEFASVNVPPRVLSDAYFKKGAYSPRDFLNKVAELVSQTPMRPSGANRDKTPVWIPMPSAGKYVVVTCPECLRTFPTLEAQEIVVGTHRAVCDYCAAVVCFEVTATHRELARAVE